MTNPSDVVAHGAEPQAAPSQTQLFEDLRTICELEDQKQAIQNEIQVRTERLRASLAQLDRDSLLYQMLASALGPPPANHPAPTRRVTKGRARRGGS